MYSTLTTASSIALYLLASATLWRQVRQASPNIVAESVGSASKSFMALTLAALTLHIASLWVQTSQSGGLDFSLGSTAAWACAVVALTFVIGMLFYPIERLGLLLLPAIALVLAATLISGGGEPVVGTHMSTAKVGHILVSVLAYALLTLAAFQAVLLILQERRLHEKHRLAILDMLPPLQTMETVLFRLIGAGFALLSLTLITGMVFSRELFGAPFAFRHHIVLACIGWLIFAALLIGHVRRGWRGRQAARWTLWGFGVLALGYFGTKIVYELIL